jgi:hypothetical protein
MASSLRSASGTAGDHSTTDDQTYLTGTAVDWANLGNLGSSNNADASAASLENDGNKFTYRLDVKNFGFSIPAGATIDGVRVDIEAALATNSRTCEDLQIRLVKGGTPTGSNKAANNWASSTDSSQSYGGASDLWSATLADTDVNASNFGVAIQFSRTTGSTPTTFLVDHVQIEVFYTEGGGSSLNVSATTDALTLAEYAATIGKSINVSANVDGLTLAEHAATIELVTGLNVSATTDALTLAEHAATIGLSLNVQAGTDALTLAEYPASLGSTQNVQATTDALTLAEYPATLSFALNVSCNTAALSLAEYSATVSSGETARPLGLSPWLDLDAEPADDRRARVRSQRERMGILEVVERFDAQEASRVIPTISRRDSTRKGSFPTDNLPPAPRSQNGTAGVLSLQAAREAQADRARLLAVLEAMEARKQIDIRRRMALLLLAAEA